MNRRVARCWVRFVFAVASAVAVGECGLPQVPDGFKIELVASEPLVRNPCAMAFDSQGRMWIGMGPQYRNPKPDTPGDSVFLLRDTDADGNYDKRQVFATGLNSIQGLAWHGRDLWIANSPDLTVVRDEDGDGVADRYVRVYTDLGNLEHGLHGLRWGPDGRLYMSKGNSKGLTRPGRLAPLPFRELWGVESPAGAPEFPSPRVSNAAGYKKNYHDPSDDWGREGGVLVCDDGGHNLEIVSRGFRNPWDIAFDSGFNFQGTDNDQNEGDRVFNPFFGSHYGWGHSWSSHWSGKDHLPTARISGPVFHGSGTGMTFYDDPRFPMPFRGVWFFNDWLRRTTFYYRPRWNGALLEPEGGEWREFVRGGNSLYKPTDIEVGPDGCLYILGWGNEYGAVFDQQGQQTNAGRVFRVSWEKRTPVTSSPRPRVQKMSVDALVGALGTSIEARRCEVQDELIRRGRKVLPYLVESLNQGRNTQRVETWVAWAVTRIELGDVSIDRQIAKWVLSERSVNLRVQAIRGLAYRVRKVARRRVLPREVVAALSDSEPRVRLAAVLAIRRARQESSLPALRGRLAVETDRVVFYAGWQALRLLASWSALKTDLGHRSGGVRLAALLALAEGNRLRADTVKPLVEDKDPRVRGVAALWMARGAGKPLVRVTPPGGEFRDRVAVAVEPGVKPSRVYYSLDGTVPTMRSPVWNGSQVVSRSVVLKLAVFVGEQRVGPVGVYRFTRLSAIESASRSGVIAVRAGSGNPYRIVDGGLSVGSRVYTDRAYVFKKIPEGFRGALIVQTSNEDSSSKAAKFLEIDTVIPVTLFVGHDTRMPKPPSWMALEGSGAYQRTDALVTTSDAVFRLYERKWPAGRIVVGGNTDDGLGENKSNYLVVVRPAGLRRLERATTVAAVLPHLAQGDAERGKALFFATGGAGCSKCHRTNAKQGLGFGPDLGSVVKQADPKKVVTSILDPSVEVKEGFRMLLVVTDGGKTHTGILKEETGTALTLLQPDGGELVVRKAEVDERLSQKISPMPSFERLLTPRQVADVTAFLMSLKPKTSRQGD